MNTHSLDNTLQVSDSIVLSKNLADDIRFQYRRVRSQDLPLSSAPAVTVQGAFTTAAAGRARRRITRTTMSCRITLRSSGHALAELRSAAARVPGRELYQRRAQQRVHLRAALQIAWRAAPQQYTVTLINNICGAGDSVRCGAVLPGRLEGEPAVHLQLWSALGDAEPDPRQGRLGAARDWPMALEAEGTSSRRRCCARAMDGSISASRCPTARIDAGRPTSFRRSTTTLCRWVLVEMPNQQGLSWKSELLQSRTRR